jgi:hypothetical protein
LGLLLSILNKAVDLKIEIFEEKNQKKSPFCVFEKP